MDSRHGKTRMNVEGDRLSSLPDDLIHKILGFVDIKHAIETSALSSRWRYIWASMPCLNFSSKDFNSLPEFSKFVTRVLSARNNKTEVHSVNLAFRGKVSQVFVKRTLDYAFSHNVQQLNITCLPVKKGLRTIESDLCVFSSHSLKNLTLSGCARKHSVSTPPAWYLPALTTMNLRCVTSFDDNTTDTTDKHVGGIFSNCANLKNLTLKNCRMFGGSDGFNISHPGLSNLTLEDGRGSVNLVTPQLKNLTIINWPMIHLVSASDLAALHYKSRHYYGNLLKVSADLLHLEKVDLSIECYGEDKQYNSEFVCLLQRLHSVKFLTLNLELVKILSSSVELISHQPSPFTNLKSLKVFPANLTEPKLTMSTEVKNYLLDSSEGATFTLVSYEEVRAVRDATSARKLMRKLQVLIDQWKENSETNMAHIEQDKSPIESHTATMHGQVEAENNREQLDTKMKCHFGERMTHIKSYWEDLNEQSEKVYKNTGLITSMLKEIERVMTNLPTSPRAKLQARFFGLCAEAESIMDNVMHRMQIQCDKKPSRSNVYFEELAASQPFS